MSRSHRYPSDLSDAEWIILAPLLPPAPTGGRPRKWPLRTVLDGIFYVVRSGCAWRMLPRDFPPWQTVYHPFRQWRLDGTGEYLDAALRERERIRRGRDPQPSARVIDSQSVKATSVGGIRGYDGAKKLSGRKRHLPVDVLGLVLRATVHAADAQGRAAVPLALEGAAERFPRLEHVWADQGYTGAGKGWIEQHLGRTVGIVRHTPNPRGEWRPIGDINDLATLRFERARLPPAPERFRGILPRRWVAGRTFSWFGQSRRLAKGYERLCETSEAMIYATMTRLMLRRLARDYPLLRQLLAAAGMDEEKGIRAVSGMFARMLVRTGAWAPEDSGEVEIVLAGIEGNIVGYEIGPPTIQYGLCYLHPIAYLGKDHTRTSADHYVIMLSAVETPILVALDVAPGQQRVPADPREVGWLSVATSEFTDVARQLRRIVIRSRARVAYDREWQRTHPDHAAEREPVIAIADARIAACEAGLRDLADEYGTVLATPEANSAPMSRSGRRVR